MWFIVCRRVILRAGSLRSEISCCQCHAFAYSHSRVYSEFQECKIASCAHEPCPTPLTHVYIYTIYILAATMLILPICYNKVLSTTEHSYTTICDWYIVAVNEKFTFVSVARCKCLRFVLRTTLGKRNGTQRKMITSGIQHSTNCFTRGTVKCFRHVFKLPKAFSSRRAAVFEAKKNGSAKAAERTSRDAQ